MQRTARNRYDTPWKSAMALYFRLFVAFYFPDVYAQIDWSRGFLFLDKEMEKIYSADLPSSLIADKLVQVYLRSGGRKWILVHVEVQSQRDPSLAWRIFKYNNRIQEHYQRQVASLVVLADVEAKWRPAEYSYRLLGTEKKMTFAVAKVADFAGRVDELLRDPNPFALVTVAHLLTQQTCTDPAERLVFKWRLVRLLYERNWSKRRIIELFKVINWLMVLPDELEEQLWQNIHRLERRYTVQWISPMERIFLERGEKRGLQKGLKQGVQKGLEKGLEKGRREGRQEGAAFVLEQQLKLRFGPLSDTTRRRLARADVDQLGRWSAALLEAKTLRQVFAA